MKLAALSAAATHRNSAMNHNTLELSCVTCITTNTNTSLHRQPQTRDAALWLQVSAHPRCGVSVTLQAHATTGGDEFAVTGVAVVPFSRDVPINRIDKNRMDDIRAEGDQLPFSWP